jgi:hypothetical protein
VDSGPQLGEKTRDFAAKKAGLGSGKTYDRARTAVENAEPEVVAAMDKGEIGVAKAAEISCLPKEVQRSALERAKSGAAAMGEDPDVNPEVLADDTMAKVKSLGRQAVELAHDFLMKNDRLVVPVESRLGKLTLTICRR